MRGLVIVAGLALGLTAGTAASAESKASTDADKMTCKRVTDTGSLVKGRKVCRKNSEWQRERSEAQKATRQLQRDNMGAPPQG